MQYRMTEGEQQEFQINNSSEIPVAVPESDVRLMQYRMTEGEVRGFKVIENQLPRGYELTQIGKAPASKVGLKPSLNLCLGTVGIGSGSVSIQELLIFLKRNCPGSQQATILSGFLRNGQPPKLVAILEKQNDTRILEAEGYCASSLRDLAYRIFFDLWKENIDSKSWIEFKYFSESVDSYRQYFLYNNEKDLERASENSSLAVASEPHDKHFDLLYNLSIIYFNKRMFLDAKKLLSKSVELRRNDYDALNMLGITLDKLGQSEEALEFFDEAIAINPTYVNAWVNKGWSMYLLGRYEECMKSYEEAIHRQPRNSKIWDNYGMAFFAIGNYEKAIECYSKAIEISKFKWALYNRGNAFLKLNKEIEAISDYLEAISIYENFTTPMVTLARLYRKRGENEESKKYCRITRSLIDKETNYNKACYHAICDSGSDHALEFLKIALEKKEQTIEYVNQDDDFEFIRTDPKFKDLLNEISGISKRAE
jgi:tetratricopeptide (TPR) repeat protein